MENPDYVEELLNKEPKYAADNLTGINLDYSDFGGFIHGVDFYFISAENTKRSTFRRLIE